MKEGLNPLMGLVRTDIPANFNEVTVLKKHETRFLHALNKGTVLPPYEIIIHPSAGCNLHCDWCIGGRVLEENDQNEHHHDLLPTVLTDTQKMTKVINSVVEYQKDGFRVENITFSGITGEPLVAKKAITAAVDILAANNVRVGLFSNSVLIDDAFIPTLMKMAYINVSLDAATPQTYAKLKYMGKPHGMTLFEKVLGNVGRVVKARNESGSNLQVNSSFILYPENYHEIYDAAKLLKGLGVNTLRMKQDISGKRRLSQDQMREVAVILDRVDNELVDDKFSFLRIHQLDRPGDMTRMFHKCVVTDLMASIGSDGNVYPCNYNATTDGIPYGSAVEEGFQAVWEGETRKQVKEGIPHICPTVCDPFKTRANNLFQAVSDSQDAVGLEKTMVYIDEVAAKIK